MNSVLIRLAQKEVSSLVLLGLKKILDISIATLKEQLAKESLVCQFALFGNDYEEVESSLSAVIALLDKENVAYHIYELVGVEEVEEGQEPITVDVLQRILERFRIDREHYEA